MRKVLLTTTALVALGGVSAASAIDISGSYGVEYYSESNTGASADAAEVSGDTFNQDGLIVFSGSSTADSGLTFGGRMTLNHAGAIEDQQMTISGDFGTIMAGAQDGMVDAMDGFMQGSALVENGSTTATTSGDVTTMKASYAIGSFTAAVSQTESDKDSTGTDEEMTSFKVSYTVTDDLSVTYGEETHETSGQSVDEEFEAITVSYTTGGMTLTAGQYDAEGLGNSSANKAERWKLGASFAF